MSKLLPLKHLSSSGHLQVHVEDSRVRAGGIKTLTTCTKSWLFYCMLKMYDSVQQQRLKQYFKSDISFFYWTPGGLFLNVLIRTAYSHIMADFPVKQALQCCEVSTSQSQLHPSLPGLLLSLVLGWLAHNNDTFVPAHRSHFIMAHSGAVNVLLVHR